MSWARRLAPVLLVAGCQGEPAAPPAPVPSPPVRPPRARSASRRLPRTAACDARDAQGRPVPVDVELAADSELALAPDARCKLLFPAGAVATVRGPARLLVAPHGEAGLVVGAGLVELDLAAAALTPESGLWLGLPGARLELVESARLVVRVLASGGAHLALVSGRAGIETAGDGAGMGLVAPAASFVSAAAVLTPEPAAALTMEDAVRWAEQRDGPAEERAQLLAGRRDQLAAQLDASAAARRTLDGLAAQHAALVARHDPGAMALQRELARESGKALSVRKRLTATAATVLALALDAEAEPGREARTLALRALDAPP